MRSKSLEQDLIAGAPALLVLYRGWWCPSSKSQLDELVQGYERLSQGGAKDLVGDLSTGRLQLTPGFRSRGRRSGDPFTRSPIGSVWWSLCLQLQVGVRDRRATCSQPGDTPLKGPVADVSDHGSVVTTR